MGFITARNMLAFSCTTCRRIRPFGLGLSPYEIEECELEKIPLLRCEHCGPVRHLFLDNRVFLHAWSRDSTDRILSEGFSE